MDDTRGRKGRRRGTMQCSELCAQWAFADADRGRRRGDVSCAAAAREAACMGCLLAAISATAVLPYSSSTLWAGGDGTASPPWAVCFTALALWTAALLQLGVCVWLQVDAMQWSPWRTLPGASIALPFVFTVVPFWYTAWGGAAVVYTVLVLCVGSSVLISVAVSAFIDHRVRASELPSQLTPLVEPRAALTLDPPLSHDATPVVAPPHVE